MYYSRKNGAGRNPLGKFPSAFIRDKC